MSAGQPIPSKGESAYVNILEQTIQGYVLAQEGAAALADALTTKAEAHFQTIERVERELDRVDREVNTGLVSAVTGASQEQTRELVTCMKMVIDLERIGDLLASVAGCARALGNRLDAEDAGELIRMTSFLERMLADTHGGFIVRNVDRALAVMRMDAEVDRLRNLFMIRHLERAPSQAAQISVHVLFMAQGLERAGDHVKNLAEEICYLVSGRSVRHLLRKRNNKSDEQMYVDWLRRRHGVDPPAADREQAIAVNSELLLSGK